MKAPSKDIDDGFLCLPAGAVLLGTVICLYLNGTLNSEALVGGYLLSSFLISLYFAGFLEDRLLKQTPDARSFGWGYFSGCMALAGAPAALVGLFIVFHLGSARHWDGFGQYLLYCVLLTLNAVVGWFVIRRRRWAWVMGTVLTGNPVLWIANYFYGRKRWNELK